MNTSVSPLPIAIWPMLGLSLALVGVTSVAVTISAKCATRIYPTPSQTNIELPATFVAR